MTEGVTERLSTQPTGQAAILTPLSPSRALDAGRECAAAFKALLELVHQIVLKPTHDKKQKLPAFSKEVATCVGEVVQAAEVLKGQPGH